LIIVIGRINSYTIVEGHTVHAAMICGVVWMKKRGVMLTTVGLSCCRFMTASLNVIHSQGRGSMQFLIGFHVDGREMTFYACTTG